MAEKLKPIGYYLGQLDSADYDGRGAMNKAAQKLRADHKRRIDADRKIERDFRNRQLTMDEKRGMVRARTHRWCHGCRKRGYLVGRDGRQLPHGPCAGDGLIRVRGGGGGRSFPSRPRGRGPGRPRRRGGRGKKRPVGGIVGFTGSCAMLIGGAESMFGTVGMIVMTVLIVVASVLKALGATVRLLGAVSK